MDSVEVSIPVGTDSKVITIKNAKYRVLANGNLLVCHTIDSDVLYAEFVAGEWRSVDGKLF
ncbi:MAG TPA: hypothetical protein VM577_07575 [Anaerovoracaceae bacterium]|nr:hypothetical protein [Anaerovoracaceae bacterium]